MEELKSAKFDSEKFKSGSKKSPKLRKMAKKSYEKSYKSSSRETAIGQKARVLL